MIINGKALAERWPVAPYAARKHAANGVSYGLTEAGYDIRVKQSVRYRPWLFGLLPFVSINHGPWRLTRFVLATRFADRRTDGPRIATLTRVSLLGTEPSSSASLPAA